MALDSNGTTGTIASSQSLPMELVEEEILCRLPVKKLLQLRCICKSWKSLISDDPKFAKKHLHMSKILKHQHHLIFEGKSFRFRGQNQILWDSPLSSVFSNTITQTQLNIPISISKLSDYIVGICSCNGILCFTVCEEQGRSAVLCNPSLRKYITLPPLKTHRKIENDYTALYSFGYDHFNDVYKVIAMSCFKDKHNQIDVYTLGTNNWRSIQDFPYSTTSKHGVFVGGTVNWLAYEEVSNRNICPVIVSLDLETESYQKIPQPDLKKEDHWTLGMFRDCLCISASNKMFLDVWIMKQYGIKESWTKLYNVPYVGITQCTYPRTGYISDDDQVLFSLYDLKDSKYKLVAYNSKNGNMNIPKIQQIDGFMILGVYVESLISLPCSY